jgi:hypothetical protein
MIRWLADYAVLPIKWALFASRSQKSLTGKGIRNCLD